MYSSSKPNTKHRLSPQYIEESANHKEVQTKMSSSRRSKSKRSSRGDRDRRDRDRHHHGEDQQRDRRSSRGEGGEGGGTSRSSRRDRDRESNGNGSRSAAHHQDHHVEAPPSSPPNHNNNNNNDGMMMKQYSTAHAMTGQPRSPTEYSVGQSVSSSKISDEAVLLDLPMADLMAYLQVVANNSSNLPLTRRDDPELGRTVSSLTSEEYAYKCAAFVPSNVRIFGGQFGKYGRVWDLPTSEVSSCS